ncbi:MAG: hypothetical protein JWO47_212 [Candidatus Saccharibacteria bacterium]|nr:hypothetical protein [Candidatus Saccharibacteria bacterium]
MQHNPLKNIVKKLKLLFFSRPVLYLLGGLIVACSVFFLISLIRELTTKNYGYHGTHYDFLAFYSAGKTVLDHNVAHLYDSASFTAMQRQIIPHPIGATGYMPFLNPPFMAVFLAPLALLNITAARLLWLAISLVLAVLILCKLTKALPQKQRLLAVALLLFTFPLFQTFIEGQVSILVLLGAAGSYLFFKQNKKIYSGASLVTLWILPQFGVFALIGLVVKREWKMLKGWALSTLAVLTITLPVTGVGIYFKYIRFLAKTTSNHFINMNTSARLDWRGSLNTSSGLNGFYESIVGQNHTGLVNALFVLTSITLVAWLLRVAWKLGKKWTLAQQAQMFCAALLVSLAIDPHLYAQDVIVVLLLLPALLLMYRNYGLKVVVIFAAFCNLVYLDQFVRLHFFTLFSVAAALVYLRKSLNLKNTR